ncbi:MAG: hypothetical protein GEU90_00600 [Gemmatimonas sp.]|nr:hypothetical protein [Gemmatimonas sp.]
MNATLLHHRATEQDGVPDDLAAFAYRMRSAGYRVRVPRRDPNFVLPEPFPVESNGELPHETIVRLRGGQH